MSNEPTMNKSAKTGQWDSVYATYYWNIHLDPKHPANSTPVLTGYSKKVGENEAQDKDQLLKRKIINLFLNSYFKRMIRIDFFMRTEFCIDKKRDPKILTLYPKYYNIEELNHDVFFKKFGLFLKDFYDRANKNKSMEGLLPKVKDKNISNDDRLNPSTYNFKSVAALYNRASYLLTNGHPPGAVNDFIRKVKDINKWE